MRVTPASAITWSESPIGHQEHLVGHPGLPIGGDGPELGGVDGRVQGQLGDARLEGAEKLEEGLRGCPTPGSVANRSANRTPSSAASCPHGESHVGLGLGTEQAQRQGEVHGQLEVDVEELRPQHEGVEVGVEVADVEAPEHGPLDLGPALPTHLVEIGVVPHVGHGAGEAAVAVEQGRGLGDRCPAVEVVLGVEGEVDPDVVAPEPRRRLPGPRGRHDQRGAGTDTVAQGVVDPDGGGMAEPRSAQLRMSSLASGR